MRSLVRATLAFLALAASVAFAAPSVETDPTVELFRKSFNAAMVDAGKDFGQCKFKMTGRQPNGPGRLVRITCSQGPFICTFAVRPNGDNSDVLVTPIGCVPNPNYSEPDEDAVPTTDI